MSDAGPTLGHMNLVVSDMAATVAFYRRLGLTLPDSETEWDAHHRSAELPGGFGLDFDSAAFAQQWNRGATGTAAGGTAVLCFNVESRERVDEIYADLTGAGYAGQQEPWDAFWGARFAIVADPDGYAVGIMSLRDPARSRPVDPPG